MPNSFPVRHESEPRPEERDQAKTILLVDDRDFERFAIRAAVEGLTNFRVCGEARNGIEALERAKELRPDLVVMDLAMPLMDGLEAARELRNSMPKVPIVLLTLYADELRGAKFSAMGIATVLSKADGLAPLIDCVEKLLGAG